jgi:hypothetical protein
MSNYVMNICVMCNGIAIVLARYFVQGTCMQDDFVQGSKA